jgi:hypothetical protein
MSAFDSLPCPPLSDTASIRDAYWDEALTRRRSYLARSRHVVAWFIVLPFIALPVIRTAMIGWQGLFSILLIAMIVAAVAWAAAAPARRDKRRFEELRARGFRQCACNYDLTGLPDDGKCPECGSDYTADVFRERWETSIREHWFPIGERRMWRALTWWQVALVGAVPIAFFTARPFAPRLGGLVVLVAIAAAIGLILYIIRGQVFEWRTLTRRNFRTCPCCLRSLAHLPDFGECPVCHVAYTPDQLRLTWSAIYRRQPAASHSAR